MIFVDIFKSMLKFKNHDSYSPMMNIEKIFSENALQKQENFI